MTEDEQQQYDNMASACQSFAALLKVAMRKLGVTEFVATWDEIEAVREPWLDVRRNDDQVLLSCRLVEGQPCPDRSN